MAVLEHLEPRSVFGFFEDLCAIPHGSGNTQAASDWLVSFARERNLEVHRDKLGNVIIIKEASPGYESAEPVIIQGHMDMVCETAADCAKDMTKEGLDLAIDGDAIYAKGTSLGGDDGIAVAMALAVLDDPDMCHPRVEAMITVDEEIGLLGAAGIDVSPITARRMLNVDSEEEGIFIVSCAGGVVAKCTIPLTREAFSGTMLTVKVSGLKGGHSGNEIDKGRGNSNKLMGRILCHAGRTTDLRLVSADGGAKDNVIPAETTAVVSVADAAAFRNICTEIEQTLKNEYRVTDPGITLTITEEGEGTPMDADSTKRAVSLLVCLPNGIETMSADMPGLVQTSLNLGILNTSADSMEASFCVRSSVSSQKEMLVERLNALTESLGGTVELFGDYPGWEYASESALRDLMVEVYKEQYGEEPRVEAIHAGLECGLLADKIPGLDCISFGPDMTDIHSCREKLYIGSVQRVWTMMVELLHRMK